MNETVVPMREGIPEVLFKRPYITDLPPPMALMLWPLLRVHLEKALAEAQGEFDMHHLYRMVADGRMVLVAVIQGMEVRAVVALERIRYPAKLSLRVALLGGNRMEDWLEPLLTHIEGQAVRFEVDDIEVAGRAGWARVLRDHGYNTSYTVLHRAVGAQEEDDNVEGRSGSG